MHAGKSTLGNSVKNAEKQLFRLKKFLKEKKDSEEALKELIEEMEKIREIVSGDTEKKKALERMVKEHGLLQHFSETKTGLEKLEKELRSNLWKLSELGELLEEFRNHRDYKFPNAENASEFLAAAMEHYSIPEIEFKIEIMGISDPEGLEKRPGIRKKGTAFVAEADSIEPLVRYLGKNGIKKGFVFRCSLFGANWKGESLIAVKAERNILKQLDSIAIRFGGRFS